MRTMIWGDCRIMIWDEGTGMIGGDCRIMIGDEGTGMIWGEFLGYDVVVVS